MKTKEQDEPRSAIGIQRSEILTQPRASRGASFQKERLVSQIPKNLEKDKKRQSMHTTQHSWGTLRQSVKLERRVPQGM